MNIHISNLIKSRWRDKPDEARQPAMRTYEARRTVLILAGTMKVVTDR